MNTVLEANNIVILSEIKDLILPLSEEAFFQLEKNIIKEGCLDPLIVWDKSPTEQILIDGHNRYAICVKNDIPFSVKRMQFATIDDVKLWMMEHQMGRRNLTPDQISYFRGYKYLTLKGAKGGYKQVAKTGRDTSQFLSAHFKVSRSTIKRDATYAEGINIIAAHLPELKNEILAGQTSIKKADIMMMPLAQELGTLKIETPDDIKTIAKKIKDQTRKQKAIITTLTDTQEDAQLDDMLTQYQKQINLNIKKIILKKDRLALKEMAGIYEDLLKYVNK